MCLQPPCGRYSKAPSALRDGQSCLHGCFCPEQDAVGCRVLGWGFVEGADGREGLHRADSSVLWILTSGSCSWDEGRQRNAPEDGREKGVMGQGEVDRRQVRREEGCCHKVKRIGPVGPWHADICVTFLLEDISGELPWCSLFTWGNFQAGEMVVGTPVSSLDPSLYLRAQSFRAPHRAPRGSEWE